MVTRRVRETEHCLGVGKDGSLSGWVRIDSSVCRWTESISLGLLLRENFRTLQIEITHSRFV